MKELIWFSIPGAVAALAAFLAFPRVADYAPSILIASAVVAGFVLHQAYRTWFEFRGGWSKPPQRDVLKKIQDDPSISGEPFLVWELGFYSDAFPDSFREHNRGAWHWVLSFRTIAFVSIASLVLMPFAPGFLDRPNAIGKLIGFAVLGALFLTKARLTHRSLMEQECEALARYPDVFNPTDQEDSQSSA